MIDPIISHQKGAKVGRIRPGTEMSIRPATIEEYEHQVQELEKNNSGRSDDIDPVLVACKWLVVLENDPEKVLFDWFSPIGGVTRERAEEEAQRYARARGAKII